MAAIWAVKMVAQPWAQPVDGKGSLFKCHLSAARLRFLGYNHLAGCMNKLFGKASGEAEPHRFGDAIARSFGLANSIIMSTESLRGSQIALNRLSIGAAQFGMSRNVEPEDTFVLAHYLTDLPYHELWSHGRPVIRQG